MKPNKQDKQSSRRGFLKGTAGGLIGTALGGSVEALSLPDDPSPSTQQADTYLKPVDLLPTNVTRTWLGPSYWANRLQDWRLHDGRLECLAGDAGDEVRTVAVLTREIIAGNKPAHLRSFPCHRLATTATALFDCHPHRIRSLAIHHQHDVYLAPANQTARNQRIAMNVAACWRWNALSELRCSVCR